MATFARSNLFLDIGRNVIPGMEITHRVGLNPDFAAVDEVETIWPVGGRRPMFSGPSTVDVESTSANDSSAGTGMRTFLMDGISASLTIAQEVMTLNGTTPVTTVNQYMAINRMLGLTAGGSGSNIGTIEASVGDTIMEVIPISPITPFIGLGRSQSGFFAVPKDRQAYITNFDYEVGMNTDGDEDPKLNLNACFLFRTLSGDQADLNVHNFTIAQNNNYTLTFVQAPQIPSGVAVEIRADRASGDKTSWVSTSFDLVIIDESIYNG